MNDPRLSPLGPRWLKYALLFGAAGALCASFVLGPRESWRQRAAWEASAPVASKVQAEGAETLKRSLNDYALIGRRNLFNIRSPEEKKPEVNPETAPQADPSLPLELVGTILDPAGNMAVFRDKNTKKQDIYAEGDQVGTVLLKKVMRHKVLIGKGDRDELVIMKFESAGKARSPRTPAAPPPAPPARPQARQEPAQPPSQPPARPQPGQKPGAAPAAPSPGQEAPTPPPPTDQPPGA